MAATRELPLSGQPYLTPTLRYDDYTIGWICALGVETEAAMYMLDTRHRGVFPFVHGDDNQYIPGEIAGHKVVIACLPRGSQGSVSAATLVTQMRQSFKRLQYGLMVGIGGGVPGRDLNPDIRLGDVVVARSSDKSIGPPGVIGYELGAETVEGFSLRDWQAPTHPRLRNAIEYIERDTEVEGTLEFLHHLEIFPTRINGKQFLHPGAEQDQLYEGDHVSNLVQRQPRGSQDPVVHYGLIASGNKLVKNAELRDKLRDKYGIICFEMEAAGIMNTLPVAVIRGICDYADSRKNDKWRRYAAATAAAYAKALLKTLPALEASASIACRTSYSQLHDIKQSFFQWPRNSYFSGREEELRKIKTELSRDKPRNQQGPLRFAIYGLGGVGKTQLVIEYCHRVCERRPHTSIFWYKASGPEGLASQYQNHAQLLRDFARSYSDERITNIANTYRHTGMEVRMIKAWITQEEDWLLVMDGFDEVVDADGVPVNLEEFIPTDSKGKVIFTSRDKRSIDIAKAHLELELKEPSPLDAVRLFVRLRHKDDVLLENLDSSDRSQIEQIVDNLKKFPLALSQAGQLLQFKAANPDYPESVMTTWETSLDYLKRSNPKAAELLQLLGFFARSDIPVNILSGATRPAPWAFGAYNGHRELNSEQLRQLEFLGNDVEFRIHLSDLVSLSLVQKSTKPCNSISLHPLVQEWIQKRPKATSIEVKRNAILCGFVVYQAYPLDLHAGFVERPATYRVRPKVEPQQLHLHLRSIFGNLHQWHNSIPLELRTLVLAELLFQIRKWKCDVEQPLSTYSLQAEDCLGSLQTGLFGILNEEKSLSLRCAYTWEKITKWLKRTLRSFPSISSWTPERVVFIVVFVSLVVAIVDLHLEDMPQKWKDKVPKRRAKVLWHLLSFLSRNNESKQDEVLFLQGIVKIQLSLSLSAEKYLTLPPPFLIEDFCPSYFKYLGIRSIAAYFNQCAAFHGPSSPTEDPHRLAGAVQFFANLFKLWYKKEEDNIKIDASNSCGYISNAFGGGLSDFRDDVSLAPEMPTLWRAVLPCVDAFLERQHSGTTKEVKRAHYLLDTVVEILRLANRSQYHATPILQREINQRYVNIYATQGSYRPRPALKALQDIF
ncbi:hypothetical protein NUW58_g4405 [Xylaria curta]|uniref:Uncharacterized protein n=1 Tax=Xylaria curta TaxID=42375 RepID=A0ACC1P6I3_9PEZI|nr:hypothetical protein NUW58_g4405 [Xylaria curta]